MYDKVYYNTDLPLFYTPKVKPGPPYVQNEWQQEAYPLLKDLPYTLINVPCGGGKTLMTIWLAVRDIFLSNFTRKQLIVTPQSHIGREFEDASILYEGRCVNWKVSKNLCRQNVSDSTAILRRFLLDDGSLLGRGCSEDSITSLSCIATHQALAMVWNDFSPEQQRFAMAGGAGGHGLTLRIDEAHHIKFAIDKKDLEGYSDKIKADMQKCATILGNICAYCVNHPELGTKLQLSTATFYRSDEYVIGSKELLDKFRDGTYTLSWNEFWRKYTNIRELHISYNRYKGNTPISLVCSNIAKEPSRFHLVILPSTGNDFRDNDTLRTLLTEITIPKEMVCDLVTKKTQEKNKDMLRADIDKKKYNYHVVITCALFNEGTNWVPCDRIHNTACERAVRLAVQRLGRCFRRFDGTDKIPAKKDVSVLYYVRPDSDNDNLRKRYTDHTNALCISMVHEDMFCPIEVPILVKNFGVSRKRNTTLSDVFGSDYRFVLEKLAQMTDCVGNKEEEVEKYIRVIAPPYLVDQGMSFEDFDEVVKAVKKAWARQCKMAIHRDLPDELTEKSSINLEEVRDSFDQIQLVMPDNYSVLLGKLTPKKMDDLLSFLKGKEEIEWFLFVKEIKAIGIKKINPDDRHGRWLSRQKQWMEKAKVRQKLADMQKIHILEEMGIEKWQYLPENCLTCGEKLRGGHCQRCEIIARLPEQYRHLWDDKKLRDLVAVDCEKCGKSAGNVSYIALSQPVVCLACRSKNPRRKENRAALHEQLAELKMLEEDNDFYGSRLS